MAFLNGGTHDRISEEVNSDLGLLNNDKYDTFYALGLDSLFNDDPFSPSFYVAGECDFENLAESLKPGGAPNELDAYLGPMSSQNSSMDNDNSRALMNNLPVCTMGTEENKRVISNNKQIPLSQSVGVRQPQTLSKRSPKLVVVHPLEENFRPRYKSDYYTQNGKVRRPRYVADRVGNHFVTLKVSPNIRCIIRVDWLTIPTKSGDRYSMPYLFQENNESSNALDRNPLYAHVNSDRLGFVKLYLVLIKSKQDELKLRQPLKPFHPFQDLFGKPDKNQVEKWIPLMPKQLIQTYQLDKSQLAFTFCASGTDGTSCIPEWDTTVYSTVLTEMTSENSRQKTMISCPNCAKSFAITFSEGGDDDDNTQKSISNKRQKDQYVVGKTMKKQKCLQDD